MATGSPPEVARVVVDLAASRPPSLGAGRLVCLDGPAGSGKTTLAAAVSELTGAQVVHMDDLMHGWAGVSGTGSQLQSIIEPLAKSRAGCYQRFNWHLGRFDTQVSVPVAPWLVIEGVGSGNPVAADQVTVLTWVEVAQDLRLARGMERDGWEMELHWRRFMAAEAALFAEHGTRERADVFVDGTGERPPRVRP